MTRETATEADRDALAARLRDIAGRHAKAKAEWQKEEADVVALRKQIATDTDVAAKRASAWLAGSYGEDFGDATTHDTRLNVFESFDPQLPEAYRNAELVFLGNIHPPCS